MDSFLQKAEKVVENNENDPDVQFRVNKISEPVLENMENIGLRLKKRREKLRRLSIRQSSIDDVIESYSDRLKDVEKRQEQQRPISAIFEIVDKQRSNSDSIVADIAELTAGFKDVERKVHEHVDKEQPQEEKDRVIESFEKIKLRYEDAKEEGTLKAKKTDEVGVSAHIYSDKITEFVAWLDNAEKLLKEGDKKGTGDKDTKRIAKKTKEILKVSVELRKCSVFILSSAPHLGSFILSIKFDHKALLIKGLLLDLLRE